MQHNDSNDSASKLRQEKITRFLRLLTLINQIPVEDREKLHKRKMSNDAIIFEHFDNKEMAEQVCLLILTMTGLKEEQNILLLQRASDNHGTYTLTIKLNVLSNDELDVIDQYQHALINRLANFMNLLNFPGCQFGFWESSDCLLFFHAASEDYLQSLNLNNQTFEQAIKQALTELCKMAVFNTDINTILSDKERAIFAKQYGSTGSGLMFDLYRLNMSPFYVTLIKSMNTLMSKQNVIPNAELKGMKKLGNGSFGVIAAATYHDALVAVKAVRADGDALSISSQVSEWRTFELLNAAKIHMPQHKGENTVIAYRGYTSDRINGAFGLVLEYGDKGSLEQFIFNKTNKVPLSLLKSFMLDIAQGLSYLHQCEIIHGDMKTANVILCSIPGESGAWWAKIIDLGTSRHKNDKLPKVIMGYTASYAAPEVLLEKEHLDEKIDMFSTGVIFWELFQRGAIYADNSRVYSIPSLMQYVAIEGKREEMPDNCPVKVSDVIGTCWKQQPENRLSAKDCVTALDTITDEDMLMTAKNCLPSPTKP